MAIPKDLPLDPNILRWEIAQRRELLNQCVGWLYTSILTDEISELMVKLVEASLIHPPYVHFWPKTETKARCHSQVQTSFSELAALVTCPQCKATMEQPKSRYERLKQADDEDQSASEEALASALVAAKPSI